jgi:signal transduction histidine kinase
MGGGRGGGRFCPVVTSLRRVRSWIVSHPVATDAATAAFVLAIAGVSSHAAIHIDEFSDPAYRRPSGLAEWTGLFACVAPLAVRRRYPLPALLCCTAGFVGSQLLMEHPESTITGVAVSIAVFSAAAYGPPRWRHVACAVCVATMMVVLGRQLGELIPDAVPERRLNQLIPLIVNLSLFCAMWALGGALGAGRRRSAELLDRTVALERQREDNARRAVFDERVRIARELHDVVAHHVSVMGIQAGAARLVMGRDPTKAADALASVEASSRQAVEELHRLLGFLRQEGDSDDLGPRPGLSQVAALAASMRGSGLEVEIASEGEKRALPPTIDVSAFRIVQEALTNTLKHAGATRAQVNLRYWPRELEVEVVDDGPGAETSARGPGGLGLIGMRERAALHGGQLTAGPAPGGGFAVRVKLPTPDAAL